MGGMEIVAREIASQQANNNLNVKVITSNLGAKNMPNFEIKGTLKIERLGSIEIAHTPIIWSLFPKLLILYCPGLTAGDCPFGCEN
jgi:hypothetical protein